NQDVWAKLANDANDVLQWHIVSAPFLKCLLSNFGVSEIGHPRKSLLNSVVAVGSQKFERAKNPKNIEQAAAFFILPAFAAREGQQQSLHALAARLTSQQAAIFIIRMGDHHHQSARGLQFSNLELEAGLAGVLRQGIVEAR